MANPKALKKLGNDFTGTIQKVVDADKFSWELITWEFADEALIEQKAAECDIVAAIGGDGTVNFAATLCLKYNLCLAIIPSGSGNGLARHLKIPLHAAKALQQLNTATIQKVDILQVNNYYAANIAGVGFDAYVAHGYAQKKKGGLLGYVSEIVGAFKSFKSQPVALEINGQKHHINCTLLAFINGSQWGYGFSIFPDAQLNDNQMAVLWIEQPKWYQWVSLFVSLLRKNIQNHSLVKVVKTKQAWVLAEKPVYLHVDGEAVATVEQVKVEVLPHQLKILV